MKSHILLQEYLNFIYDFQQKYEGSHVGGSFGLFLHGIDLKRHLTQSDVDMTIAHFALDIEFPNMEDSSDASDFDRCTRINLNEAYYIKVDMKYNPSAKYDVIYYDGKAYNVTKLDDILEWKQKFAEKGVQKHIDDLAVIKGGERSKPEKIVSTATAGYQIDDSGLPF